MLRLIFAFALAAGLCMGCSDEPTTKGQVRNPAVKPLPHVKVTLGQDIDTIEGITWRYVKGRPFSIMQVEEPRRVTISAGDRELLTVWSKAIHLEHVDGRLGYLFVLPMEELAELSAAYEHALKILDQIRVGPDHQMDELRAALERWMERERRTAKPGRFFGRMVRLDGTVFLLLELRRHEPGNRWSYHVGFQELALYPDVLERHRQREQ